MRILIISNGSPQADPALVMAAQITRRAGESPVLLKVLDPTTESYPPYAAKILQADRQVSDIPDVQVKIRLGSRDEEILQELKDGQYALAIMGAKASSRLARFLRKDPLITMVESLSCSVLIAKGKIKPIRRILLCDSGSKQAFTLSRFAAQLISILDGSEEIIVLHVMSQISAGPGIRGAQLRADADKLIHEHSPEGTLLEQDIETLKNAGLHPTAKVRHGLVVDEIFAEATTGDYDLVVIGAHHHEGWQGLFLDDLSRKIITQMDRPVLVVK